MVDTKKSYVTEVGTLVWPALNTPDDYRGQNKYKAYLEVSAKEADRLRKIFQPILEEYAASEGVEELNSLPISPVKDKDGYFVIRTKMNAEYKDKKTKEIRYMRPKLLDSDLQRIPHTTIISGGSRARVNFTVWPYTMTETIKGEDGEKRTERVAGLSFRLQGVQIKELVQYSGGDTLGFEADPDGYTADFPEDGGDADY